MTTEPVRASSRWLAMRETADGEARATDLVELVRAGLPADRPLEIRDLGCGTGAMARWLGPALPGPQHWVLYDRDVELLTLVHDHSPDVASDGSPVLVETRCRDITRLSRSELAGASLVTASALLDMMTEEELQRLVAACARAGCAVLITLTVIGRVELTPADPLDKRVGAAFNYHQGCPRGGASRLGPDAVDAAVGAFTGLGLDVELRPSPWRLGPGQRELTAEWFTGWLAAAREQDPELDRIAAAYARRRLDQAAAGQLLVTVEHRDLLVRHPRVRSGQHR